MNDAEALHNEICRFKAYVNTLGCLDAPSEDQFRALTSSLIQLSTAVARHGSRYRAAAPHEERLYELAVGSDNSPSLYLVSDGHGVITPPHEHKTWVIIAGVRGIEINRLYAVHSAESRIVSASSAVAIGPGEAWVLHSDEIHSTAVISNEASFHLHLYGRPLHALPSFHSRCFSIADGP